MKQVSDRILKISNLFNLFNEIDIESINNKNHTKYYSNQELFFKE